MIVHQPLDVGVALDMLSILQVKHARTTGAAPAAANLATFSVPLSGQLGDQLGKPLYATVIQSPEYQALYTTNAALFDLIDLLKSPARPEGICFDVEVDKLNLQRWRDKRALQARFWPEQPMSEQKLGYGQIPST